VQEKPYLYNANIYPFTVGPLALSAILWSQGECNADTHFHPNQTAYYACAFPKMIDAWRSALNAPASDLLFAFEVLPAYVNDGGACPSPCADLPDLRLSQLAGLDAAGGNVFAANAIDLGDATAPHGSVHPRDKQTVGARMAAGILALQFGRQVPYLAPTFESAYGVAAGADLVVTVSFRRQAGSSGALVLRPAACPVGVGGLPADECSWLEVQTSDGAWHNATGVALSSDATALVLTVPGAGALRANATRSFYSAWPVVVLFSAEGIPALPWWHAADSEVLDATPAPAAAVPATAAPAASAPEVIGFVYTSEGYSHPSAPYGSTASEASLRALAATGANTVSLVATGYVDSVSATAVHSIASPSPMRSATPAEFAAALATATSLNLSVVVNLRLDLAWDRPELFDKHAYYKDGSLSRESIGSGISGAGWDAFFASWEEWMRPFVAAAQAAAAPGQSGGNCSRLAEIGAGVVAISIGDELTSVWPQEARVRALVASVRSAFGGCVTAGFTGASLAKVAWLDALSLIGVDAFWSLDAQAGPLPLGQAPSVPALVAGWEAQAVGVMAAAAAQHGLPVLVVATGAESRPNCHLLPWGTGAPGAADGNDQGDDSAWPCAYDMSCQANSYAAALEALRPHAVSSGGWFAGALFWRWLSDPTAGGTSDSDFTPHGKQAEAVVRDATGRLPEGCVVRRSASGSVEVVDERDALDRAAARCTGADAVVEAMRSAAERLVGAGRAAREGDGEKSREFSGFRGFVWGQEEWSSPFYRLDSQGAATSLANLKSVGANAVELVVQVSSRSDSPVLLPTS